MARRRNKSHANTVTPSTYEPVELSIGARIKSERERLALDFEQLSVLTAWCDQGGKGPGIASVTLRRYEREGTTKTLPGLRELRILCRAFDVSADRLLLDRHESEDEARMRRHWDALRGIVQDLAQSESLRSAGVDAPNATDAAVRDAQLRKARLRQRPGDRGADSLL
jgi:transcriptional regulator with XRE-family HTH domain